MIEWIKDGQNRLTQARTPQEKALMQGHLKLMQTELKTLGATLTLSRGAETSLVLPESAIRLPEIQTVGMSNGEMERLANATRGT